MVHNYTTSIIGRFDAIRQDGTLPIVLLVVINRKPVRISLQITCRPEEFDPDKGRITYRKKDDPTGELSSDANMSIIQAQLKANQIFLKYRYLDQPLDKETFVKEYKGGLLTHDFYEFVENAVIKEFEKTNAASTVVIYNKALDWLKKYKPKCMVQDLSPLFVDEFDRFMKQGGLSQNTRMKYMKTFKFFTERAKKHKILFADVFENYSIKRIRGTREYLEVPEMKQLITLYYKDELPAHLQITLRKFIFSMFTGIRISDLQALTDFNIIGNTLVFKPVKTAYSGKIVKVPLSDIAGQFIDKEVTGRVFEKQTDDIVNKNLKVIALSAEIPKHLTSHVARHTFATNFAELDGNIPALQLILGHSKIETTMEYVHMSKKRREVGMKKFDVEFAEFLNKKGPNR